MTSASDHKIATVDQLVGFAWPNGYKAVVDQFNLGLFNIETEYRTAVLFQHAITKVAAELADYDVENVYTIAKRLILDIKCTLIVGQTSLTPYEDLHYGHDFDFSNYDRHARIMYEEAERMLVTLMYNRNPMEAWGISDDE